LTVFSAKKNHNNRKGKEKRVFHKNHSKEIPQQNRNFKYLTKEEGRSEFSE
jgi:hypothetical protein